MNTIFETLKNIIFFSVFEFNDQSYSIGMLLAVPILLWVAYLFFKGLNAFILKKLRKNQVAPDLILLIQRLYYILALIVVVITALDIINVPLTAFAFVSGAIAIGFGFGAQNIINNFISGWILMWERPIRIGDFLEIGDVKGTVETINTRSTRIRRTDGVHLLIPNSHLLENMVVNWTLIDKLARCNIRVGVAYGSPVKQVSELINLAAKQHPDVLEEPGVIVIFEDFGDSSLIFDLYFWINAHGEKDLRAIKSDIRFSIDKLFAENDIVISFPQRDVHVDGQLKIVQSNNSV